MTYEDVLRPLSLQQAPAHGEDDCRAPPSGGEPALPPGRAMPDEIRAVDGFKRSAREAAEPGRGRERTSARSAKISVQNRHLHSVGAEEDEGAGVLWAVERERRRVSGGHSAMSGRHSVRHGCYLCLREAVGGSRSSKSSDVVEFEVGRTFCE